MNNLCPRCGENVMDKVIIRNALSRTDNKTYICNRCGINEAMEAMFGGIKSQEEWSINKGK
jgi:uncharacterized Zn finger protein